MRLCNSDGTWGDPNINACDSAISGKIKEVSSDISSIVNHYIDNEKQPHIEVSYIFLSLVMNISTSIPTGCLFREIDRA